MILKLKQTPGIYLIGFMACGKTTVGGLLARHMGWEFADLDRDIEVARNATIPRLFETLGEPGFRRMEAEAMGLRVRSIKNGRPTVLALGGGAYIHPGNAELLESSGVSIWLDAPMETIERRVRGCTNRPLAADPVIFRQLYEARRDIYARAAYTVPVISDDPAETLGSILGLPIFS